MKEINKLVTFNEYAGILGFNIKELLYKHEVSVALITFNKCFKVNLWKIIQEVFTVG